MDEREQALRDSAHVWAYDVPCVLYILGLAMYFVTYGNVSKMVARMLLLIRWRLWVPSSS